MSKVSQLTSVAATRAVLDEFGLSTKKALGQHFLISDGVVSRILEVAGVSPSDTILEVGPGIGTLTVALLARAGAVVAIERDTDLPAVLAQTCGAYRDTFSLISKDALEVGEQDLTAALTALGEGGAPAPAALPAKLVSNLPYAVAATIVLDYFERFPFLTSQTIMVQSEVADRMCAKPGTKEYGGYTIKLGLYAQPTARFSVGPQNFFPPPRVDSAVIRLDRCPAQREGRPLSPAETRATCLMVDASFATRRKTISNSCKTYLAGRGEEGARIVSWLPALFEAAAIDPRRRGETLSLDEFMALGCALAARNA